MTEIQVLTVDRTVNIERKICRPYGYESRAYAVAFERFLSRTDQKRKASDAVLDAFGEGSIEAFVDVGAGDGTLTKMVSRNCRNKVLIEPNAFFGRQAALRLPDARIFQKKIQDIDFSMQADAVLVAHVFFHIDPGEWLDVLRKCRDLLRVGGILVLLLQNKSTDYMKIFDALNVDHKNLDFIVDQGMPAKIGMEILKFKQIPSYVECNDEIDIVEIGEFQLNCLSGWEPMSGKRLIQLTDMVTRQSNLPRKISCSQDILILSKSD
jgi:SAM-dependent methyltransferase